LNFLLDVHISTGIARALVDAGHSVLRAALAFPTAPDAELIQIALNENRIIITEDSDFTALIFTGASQPPPGLIYIRCEPEDQLEMADRVLEVLEMPSMMGHVATLTKTNVRFRALPDQASSQ
jgi:predicted nuclease of predicted toxin-antitoxin system